MKLPHRRLCYDKRKKSSVTRSNKIKRKVTQNGSAVREMIGVVSCYGESSKIVPS